MPHAVFLLCRLLHYLGVCVFRACLQSSLLLACCAVSWCVCFVVPIALAGLVCVLWFFQSSLLLAWCVCFPSVIALAGLVCVFLQLVRGFREAEAQLAKSRADFEMFTKDVEADFHILVRMALRVFGCCAISSHNL